MEKLIKHHNFKGNLEDEKNLVKPFLSIFLILFSFLQIADVYLNELKYQMPFTRWIAGLHFFLGYY